MLPDRSRSPFLKREFFAQGSWSSTWVIITTFMPAGGRVKMPPLKCRHRNSVYFRRLITSSFDFGMNQCMDWRLPLSSMRSEEHTSELQSPNAQLVCRLLIEKKNKKINTYTYVCYHDNTTV